MLRLIITNNFYDWAQSQKTWYANKITRYVHSYPAAPSQWERKYTLRSTNSWKPYCCKRHKYLIKWKRVSYATDFPEIRLYSNAPSLDTLQSKFFFPYRRNAIIDNAAVRRVTDMDWVTAPPSKMGSELVGSESSLEVVLDGADFAIVVLFVKGLAVGIAALAVSVATSSVVVQSSPSSSGLLTMPPFSRTKLAQARRVLLA